MVCTHVLKTVAEVLLIVGVQVQLSLLAIDHPLKEGGVSTLAPFKDLRLDQVNGMTGRCQRR